MRLVDPGSPFQVVYSAYHHEYLGYMISAHYVQVEERGTLSLIHQGAYPENIDQFLPGIAAPDVSLIELIATIQPREIVKKFNGNPRKETEFFMTRFDGELKKMALSFIQRQMAKILPRLAGRDIYIMGKDSYPAQEVIHVLEEKATVLFHFHKEAEGTTYFPTIKLRGERIKFQFKKARLLCMAPAWMYLEGELFTFTPDLDGKKLKPFLEKYNIEVKPAQEEMYYEKFIPQIIERYQVHATGFTIYPRREPPQFLLQVNEHESSSLSFERQVRYGEFTFPLEMNGRYKAFFRKEEGEFVFHRVERNCNWEKEVLEELDKIPPKPSSLTPWGFLPKEEGLTWLSRYHDRLRAIEVEVVQEEGSTRIHLRPPEISMDTAENGDWFDIKAVVRIGEFEIPFLKFRNHIISQRREYQLPDGSIAILPDHWFSDYLHLMEVSEQQDGDRFSIRKYQAPLLNMPSKTASRDRLVEAIKNLENIPEVAPPVHLNAVLRSYQQEGFNWLNFLKNQQMGGILADDMGLGKTLQTLSLLQHEKEAGIEQPSLIVMPTSLLHNWYKEAEKFAPQLRVHLHVGVNRSKKVKNLSPYHVILTTYGIVRQDIKLLKTFPFHYVVLDESQMIKNPGSKTTKAVCQLVSKHRLSLTGTPIENTVMDIWSQMAFLNPGLLGNEAFFKQFYVTPIEKEQDLKRSAKLRRIIYPFILRRKKQQVEKDLPPRIEKLHFCEMETRQRELYDETRSSYRNYLLELVNQGAWKKNKLNILTGLQKLRQIAIHPKMIEPDNYTLTESGKYREVKRLLKKVIERKRSKVLIFSQFVKMLHLLRDDLEAEGIPFCYLDGSTRDRQAQVDEFQTNKEIQTFLISLKAGGVGLNLTAADYVFILDPWWNPAVENQAIDRSHRIGQDRTVFFYKFITEDSIEEKILALQRRKAQLSDDIIAIEEDVYKSLDATDLEDLLN